MKNKPDDRSDNVEKIQHNINNTRENIEMAEDMIGGIDNVKTKNDLKMKNDKRKQALDGMRREIQDEAESRNRNPR
jgi:small acid-soluble spore protein (thioredoxin-like protein)